MREAGVADVNPGHPQLLALIAAGATDAEFAYVAEESVSRGKGYAYALAMLTRQRDEAAKASLHGPLPTQLTPRQRATKARTYELSGGILGSEKQEFVDAEPAMRALG